MLYFRKIYTLLIFNLFIPLSGQTKESLCPPGTKETWGCNPGQKELKRICAVCTSGEITHPATIKIDIKNSSHSSSDSSSDSGFDSGFDSGNIRNEKPIETFFSRSWQKMLLSKETLITTITLSLSTYLYLCYQLKKATWLMKEQGAWCNWKAKEPFETFKSIDKKELAQELLEAIQNRYLNSSNATDHVGPLNSFLEDYRRELYIFRSYFFIATWIKRLHLTRIFPINNQDIGFLKERVERLCYIKAIFFEWAAHYKTKRCIKNEKE
jgi:hypothetical protein